MQQHMIQQLLQDMNNSGEGGNTNGTATRDGLRFGSNTSAGTAATVNVPGSAAGPTPPSRSNSFKAASNSDASAAAGNNRFNQKAPDVPQNLHLSEEMVQEFADSGFLVGDLDDSMGFGW